MKKKLLLEIFVFGIILFALVFNTQSITTFIDSDDQKKGQLNLTLSSTSHKLLDLSLTPHEPIEILNDGDFTDYGFSGLGTAEEPYNIENYNITTTKNLIGILIIGTTKHFVIRNCYVDTKSDGIYISNVAEGTVSITKNTVKNNNWYGINLYSSSGVTLTNNTCSSNYVGIYLYSSSGATLKNNTCSNNDYGIRLRFSSGATLKNNTCSNNYVGVYLSSSSGATLMNNTCSNDVFSIRLEFSSGATLMNNTCRNNGFGFYLEYSPNTTLTKNTCKNNRWGIRLEYTNSCLLTNNLLQENEEYGIFLDSNSGNNIIHHNIFIDNNLGGTSQAYDEGTKNTWHDSIIQEGNYWNDWNKKKPYLIDGDARSKDRYPLNEVLERINYGFIFIPALFLAAILIKRKRNNYFKT